MLTNFVNEHKQSMPQPTKARLIQLAFTRDPAKLFQEKDVLPKKFNKQTKKLQLYWGKEDLF